MTEAVTPARRQPWVLAAAALMLVLLAFGGVLAAVESDGGSRTASAPGTAEIRRIHATLHAIDRVCTRAHIDPATRRLLERDARMFARFARTYPQARFQIDDEDARPVSMLLVAREALRRCAPGAAAIVDAALPANMR